MPNQDRPKSNSWLLKTPPGTTEYTIHTDEKDGIRIFVCTVGKAVPSAVVRRDAETAAEAFL